MGSKNQYFKRCVAIAIFTGFNLWVPWARSILVRMTVRFVPFLLEVRLTRDTQLPRGATSVVRC